jgi:gamma-glutamyl-gamma-aminobutyrate hydrolase PuuD
VHPCIGLTSSFLADTSSDPPREKLCLNAAYSDAVFAAGGIALPLPVPAGGSETGPTGDPTAFDELIAAVDGLIFTGGDDIDPRQYGEAAHPKTDLMHRRRSAFEVEFFRRADVAGTPILAICLGFQVAHVARGGKLIQHLDDLERTPLTPHRQDQGRSAFHRVRIAPDCELARVVGATEIETNSRHHQGVDTRHQGHGLRPVAYAPDGVLEGSEDCDGRFLLAVQWHPEDLINRPEHLRLFEALVQAAADRQR